MSVAWACDICGKSTHINPPVEYQFTEEKVMVPTGKEVEKEFEVPDPKDPRKKIKQMMKTIEVVNVEQVVRKPKMAVMKRQNHQSGEIEDIPIQEIKDLEPRAFIVRLTLGQEQVQRDFCRDCLEKEIVPHVKHVWDMLAKIGSK